MEGRDWRALKRQGTRRRLTEAAFELFDEHGYAAVTVGDIAERADLSVPTFYSYFRTKEHVVLPDQDLDWVADHLAAQPSGVPLTEQLRLGLQSMVAGLPPEAERHLLRRWTYVRSDTGLQLRGADREHTSAAVVVVVVACLRAATAALLRWAATDGREPLAGLIDEAFAALRSM